MSTTFIKLRQTARDRGPTSSFPYILAEAELCSRFGELNESEQTSADLPIPARNFESSGGLPKMP
jgi:hypothetical protein